jgi:hypothetical protein
LGSRLQHQKITTLLQSPTINSPIIAFGFIFHKLCYVSYRNPTFTMQIFAKRNTKKLTGIAWLWSWTKRDLTPFRNDNNINLRHRDAEKEGKFVGGDEWLVSEDGNVKS